MLPPLAASARLGRQAFGSGRLHAPRAGASAAQAPVAACGAAARRMPTPLILLPSITQADVSTWLPATRGCAAPKPTRRRAPSSWTPQTPTTPSSMGGKRRTGTTYCSMATRAPTVHRLPARRSWRREAVTCRWRLCGRKLRPRAAARRAVVRARAAARQAARAAAAARARARAAVRRRRARARRMRRF